MSAFAIRAAFLAVALALISPGSPVAAQAIDVGAWARALPSDYAVSGFKNEPTYLAAIDIERRGDLFTITGGAPAWAERSSVSMRVTPAGDLVIVACPKPLVCDGAPPAGFLASAALVAAARRGADLGTVEPVAYGERNVICLPGERLGILEPILDPCFDVLTGAVLAQRHRRDGSFDGPSLDPASIKVHGDDHRAGAS